MTIQFGEPTISLKPEASMKTMGLGGKSVPTPIVQTKIVGTDKTLMEMIQENQDEVLGKGYTLHETLRLAYLDTKDALSIQVHPEDDYALEHSNDYGKI